MFLKRAVSSRNEISVICPLLGSTFFKAIARLILSGLFCLVGLELISKSGVKKLIKYNTAALPLPSNVSSSSRS